MILKRVVLYLQNDSYLISNSPYTIKLASKLRLGYSNFILCDGLICGLIQVSSILMKICENNGKL